MHEGEKGYAPQERPEMSDERRRYVLTNVLDFENTLRNEPGVADELKDAVASVSPEAVAPIVAETIAAMKEDRDGERRNWKDLPAAEVFTSYSDSASRESHAIQCSVNKEVDLRIVLAAVERDTEHVPETLLPDKEFVAGVLERQIRMNHAMSEVYTSDILRRIGLKKGEASLVDAGLAKLDTVRESVLATLDEFESANKEKVAATPGLDDLLRGLRASVSNAPHERLGKTLYEEIAKPYSMVIGYDIEDFNDQELREALERLETAG